MNNSLKLIGMWELTCRNPDGTMAWHRRFRNAPTTVGLEYLVGCGFNSTAQITAWQAGLISSVGYTGLAVGDTMASHAGWTEYTGYSGARPTWVKSGAGGLLRSNGPFTFPITANGIVKGGFITSGSVVGGSSGTLWSTALAASQAVVTVGQSLTGTYSVQLVGG